MLVIEEAFDEWVLGRTDFGLHITFEDRWEKDLKDMILRDCNHHCIVLWSTGNEMEERDGSANGYAWSRRLAEKVRSLDRTRTVTASACSLFVEYIQRPSDKGTSGNQTLNMAYDAFAEGRDLWGPATAEYSDPLDAAGYNYKVARYECDGEKFPERVIYGSESYPRAALESWQAAERNPHVIGDINLLGQKRPQSYYRDFVWKQGRGPKMFCLPPELVGKNIARLSWGWLPVRKSYTFAGQEGRPVEVHICADVGEVELLCNGVSQGPWRWTAGFFRRRRSQAGSYLLFGSDSCSMFEGTTMAVIRGEAGAKGCMVEVSLGGITAQLPVRFSPKEEDPLPVHDTRPGPFDVPLGELMADPATKNVLKKYLAAVVDNPMVDAIKGYEPEEDTRDERDDSSGRDGKRSTQYCKIK